MYVIRWPRKSPGSLPRIRAMGKFPLTPTDFHSFPLAPKKLHHPVKLWWKSPLKKMVGKTILLYNDLARAPGVRLLSLTWAARSKCVYGIHSGVVSNHTPKLCVSLNGSTAIKIVFCRTCLTYGMSNARNKENTMLSLNQHLFSQSKYAKYLLPLGG